MTTCKRETALDDVRSLFDVGVVSGLTDGELLERFVTRRGERAFTVLVERHGPMVLRVCRNILGDAHDVEDAFQATFLVLLRKAGSIRNRASCASWLQGVALRVAAEVRTEVCRRRMHERRAAKSVEAPNVAETGDDLWAVIDEGLARLRERYRSPLVLCYLEGHTCEEAAQRLGWPVGTVKKGWRGAARGSAPIW